MVHVVIGILAIAWGIWMLLPDWMFAGPVLAVLAYIGLVAFGIVAFLAGTRQLRTNK